MSLIILERDGVINHMLDGLITAPSEWKPIEGSLEAIARLNQAGYRVVVITNQPGIAQGKVDVDTLTQIHSKMRRMLAQVGGKIEAILYCPHGSDDDCICRKPLHGAFSELANRLRIDLTNIPSVGCSLIDVQAAQTAGARPILVRAGEGNEVATKDIPSGIEVYDNLAAVATWLLDVQY